jgi:hypothetical protein
MQISRREALLATPSLLILASCGAAGTAVIDAQALADAQGVTSTAVAIYNAVLQYAPKALSADAQTQITVWTTAATNAISALSGTTPAPQGASQLQIIDTDINAALGALGAVLPAAAVLYPPLAPFVTMYDMALPLLPVIEAWANSVIKTVSAKPTVQLVAIKQKRTVDEARAYLHIPVKH